MGSVIINFENCIDDKIKVLILRTSLTNLIYSSYQEIAYLLGGGRASIFFITLLLVTYYLTLPSEYLSN